MSVVGPITQPQPTLDEMLRVMDVATELRKQRETVEKEFAIDETMRLLRERLLSATSITGERVTEEEVDLAIKQYFENLHTFREPPASLEVALARVYVRRGELSVTLLLVMALAGCGWYLLHTSAGMFSRTARSSRQAVQQATSPEDLSRRLNANTQARATELATTVRAMTDKIRAIAHDGSIPGEIDRLLKELDVARQQADLKSLTNLNQRVNSLFGLLDQAYEVHIVSGPNERSGIDRFFEDETGKRVSGYYVIVEARDANGKPVTRTIRNSETQQLKQVTRWAERVPQSVYDRIKADKKSDGILDETLFAVKERGYQNEELKLASPDGQPITRLGQITDW